MKGKVGRDAAQLEVEPLTPGGGAHPDGDLGAVMEERYGRLAVDRLGVDPKGHQEALARVRGGGDQEPWVGICARVPEGGDSPAVSGELGSRPLLVKISPLVLADQFRWRPGLPVQPAKGAVMDVPRGNRPIGQHGPAVRQGLQRKGAAGRRVPGDTLNFLGWSTGSQALGHDVKSLAACIASPHPNPTCHEAPRGKGGDGDGLGSCPIDGLRRRPAPAPVRREGHSDPGTSLAPDQGQGRPVVSDLGAGHAGQPTVDARR